MSEPHDKALEAFTEYFVRNYPGPDTVIFDPKWHAPKIFNAAKVALNSETSALIEELDRLREALEFYADELTWADTHPKNDDRLTVLVPSPSFAEIDRGERAREALASQATEGREL